MKIAVYGSGGVGGYFGGRLASTGQDVAFIARGDHLKAMRQKGLAVESINGDFHMASPTVTDDPQTIGPVDVVLVAVKSWQVPEVALAMRPLMGPDTLVVSLLNGVEAVGQLSAVLGQDRVLGGVAKIFSFIGKPGLIRHIGHEPTLMLGEQGGGSSKRLDRLAELLEMAGVVVECPAAIMVEIWKKFLFTTGWGGLGAISRAPIGVLREEPATRSVIQACMLETEAVARAAGISLPADIIGRTWAFINGLEPAGTSSLQRDIAAGRPSELDAWNGAVVRIGQHYAVATPTHDLIVSALTPLERRARGELNF
ncbi:2-dehydropantoate 2-reductase [Sedimenticola selenatireducens]|uniref:2-dehydropantoate 2-reductase n=1 Tax=Sedimenticola selenatireducens TaxID=191960 RepID=A0A558DYV7_9GAMM|nr:2-dehydropantoate 2-reductase [Sedimenticola selenatireducens]TVO71901.1 2-dehydropantoate 2-reductase [Sedimenticola selenatireducens]TVT66281.1 MAG: 2-dehydropantoate 2-reductase [Sedimenticola selenatireducens]